MSAEILREAAALMRERAEAATPGPWMSFEPEQLPGVYFLTTADENDEGEVGNLFWVEGGMFASADAFRIVVRGAQTHGGYPWDGTDPIRLLHRGGYATPDDD